MEKSNYRFGDILVGMLSYLPKKKRIYRRTNGDVEIKEFFVRNKDIYTPTRNVPILFDRDGVFISSRTIEESLEDLRTTRLLSSDDFFKTETANSSVNYLWKKFRKDKFTREEISEIKDLSKKFADEFCI